MVYYDGIWRYIFLFQRDWLDMMVRFNDKVFEVFYVPLSCQKPESSGGGGLLSSTQFIASPRRLISLSHNYHGSLQATSVKVVTFNDFSLDPVSSFQLTITVNAEGWNYLNLGNYVTWYSIVKSSVLVRFCEETERISKLKGPDAQNHWVRGLCPSSGIINNYVETEFRKLDCG
jgi:hypothetical protein